MIFFSIAAFDQLSVLTFVFTRQCSRLKALGQQFNKTLSFCEYYIHSVLLILLGIYDWYLITQYTWIFFRLHVLHIWLNLYPCLPIFDNCIEIKEFLQKVCSFVLFCSVNFLFKSFTIEKVIGAKASTQSNQLVLTTRCYKLSSKGIQFGKGKHLLNCSHYFEEHTLLKLQLFTLTVTGKPSTVQLIQTLILVL